MTDPSDKARIRDLEQRLADTQAENLRLQRDADDAHMASEVYRECAAYRAQAIRALCEERDEAERHLYDLQDELAAAEDHARQCLDLALGYAADNAQMAGAGDELATMVATLDGQLTEAHDALDAAGIERLADSTADAEPLSLAGRIRTLSFDRDELRRRCARLRDELSISTLTVEAYADALKAGGVDQPAKCDNKPWHEREEWWKHAPVGAPLIDDDDDALRVVTPWDGDTLECEIVAYGPGDSDRVVYGGIGGLACICPATIKDAGVRPHRDCHQPRLEGLDDKEVL